VFEFIAGWARLWVRWTYGALSNVRTPKCA